MINRSMILFSCYLVLFSLLTPPKFGLSRDLDLDLDLASQPYVADEPRVAKSFEEAKGLLRELSDVTQRWLTCRNYDEVAVCDKLDFRDPLEENQLKRLKLFNLLKAKQRFHKESMGVRTGVNLKAIETDIDQLHGDLQESLKVINGDFFTKKIGEDPFERQMAYFHGREFQEHLRTLDNKAWSHEIRMQLTLLRTINPTHFDNNDNMTDLISRQMLNEAAVKLKVAGEVERTKLEQKAASFFESFQHKNQTGVDNLLGLPTGAKDEDRLIAVEAALSSEGFTKDEVQLLRIWQGSYDQTPDALAAGFLWLFQDMSFDKSWGVAEEEATEEQIEAQRITDKRITDSINLQTGVNIAGDVKWGLTAFLDIPYRGAFFGSVCVLMAAVVLFVDDMPREPEEILGAATAIVFATAYSRHITPYTTLVGLGRDAVIRVWGNIGARLNRAGGAITKVTSKWAELVAKPRVAHILKYYIGHAQFAVHVAFLTANIFFLYDTFVNWKSKDLIRRAAGLTNAVVVTSLFGLYTATLITSVPGANVIFFLGTLAAMSIFVIDQFAHRVVRDIKPDDNNESVRYYKYEVNPNKSYYQWCEKEGDANCEQQLHPSTFLGVNNRQEPLVMGERYGGPGGEHELKLHLEGLKQTDELNKVRISRIQVWNCRNEEVGLEYTVKPVDCAGSSCSPKTYHMGCGSNHRHRRHLKDYWVPVDDSLQKVKIYHSIVKRSRRVVKVDFTFKSQKSIATEKFSGIDYYHNHEFDSTLEYNGLDGSSLRTEGEIIGLHGRYGSTIDSLGVYARGKAKTVYKAVMYKKDAEWRHRIVGGVCLQYKPIPDTDAINYRYSATLLESLRGQPGPCQCESFVSYHNLPPLETHQSRCQI